MGVVVPNPQDSHRNLLFSWQDLTSPPPRMRLPRNPNSSKSMQPNRPRNNRRKRSRNTSPSPRTAVDAPQFPDKKLVMGHVKILKPGEQFAKTVPDEVSESAEVEKTEDLDLGSTHCLGPDPELLPTHIELADSKVNGFYAGSALIAPPSPTSLPLPASLMKKCDVGVKNNDATSYLRQILGLTLF